MKVIIIFCFVPVVILTLVFATLPWHRLTATVARENGQKWLDPIVINDNKTLEMRVVFPLPAACLDGLTLRSANGTLAAHVDSSKDICRAIRAMRVHVLREYEHVHGLAKTFAAYADDNNLTSDLISIFDALLICY